jgi:hypothetical protein
MLQQQHLIVVERSFNHKCIVRGFGKTPQEAARKVFDRAREYGYRDATKTYPKAEAEPGTEKGLPEKGSPRDDR